MDADLWVPLATLVAIIGTLASVIGMGVAMMSAFNRLLGELRTELKTDIGDLRTELKTDIGRVDDRLYDLAAGRSPKPILIRPR